MADVIAFDGFDRRDPRSRVLVRRDGRPRPALGTLGAAAPRDDLLAPSFEHAPRPTVLRWWLRRQWRKALAREFAHVPDEMLADFGLTRRALEDYVTKPFWRA